MKRINSFDIDGVIHISKDVVGLHPGPDDVIITGRSREEIVETCDMLLKRGITNQVYFNPLPFDKKTRESSGFHKATTINKLLLEGIQVIAHFEDDEIQAKVIEESCGGRVHVIRIVHDLTNKENVRHDY